MVEEHFGESTLLLTGSAKMNITIPILYFFKFKLDIKPLLN